MTIKFRFSLFFFFLFLLFTGCSENNKLKRVLVDYNTEIHEKFQDWDAPNPMDISRQDSIIRRIAFLQGFENKLLSIDSTQLEDSEYQIWKRELDAINTQKQAWESYFQDPSAFDVTYYLRNGLQNASDTLQALQKLSEELVKVPRHFESAKKMIYAPDPDKSSLGVQKQLLFLRFLQIELPDFIKNSRLTGKEGTLLKERVKAAKMASKDYIGFCESLVFEHFDSTMVRGR